VMSRIVSCVFVAGLINGHFRECLLRVHPMDKLLYAAVQLPDVRVVSKLYEKRTVLERAAYVPLFDRPLHMKRHYQLYA
jgi:hypothetical protein